MNKVRLFLGLILILFAQAARPMSPYVILGLPEGASLEEVKARYRALSCRWHPDKAEKLIKDQQLSAAEGRWTREKYKSEFKKYDQAYNAIMHQGINRPHHQEDDLVAIFFKKLEAGKNLSLDELSERAFRYLLLHWPEENSRELRQALIEILRSKTPYEHPDIYSLKVLEASRNAIFIYINAFRLENPRFYEYAYAFYRSQIARDILYLRASGDGKKNLVANALARSIELADSLHQRQDTSIGQSSWFFRRQSYVQPKKDTQITQNSCTFSFTIQVTIEVGAPQVRRRK